MILVRRRVRPRAPMTFGVLLSISILALSAVSVSALSGCSRPSDRQAEASPSSSLALIPIPQQTTEATGRFQIRDETVIEHATDEGSAAVARYFADTLQSAHGLALRLRARDPNSADAEGVIEFQLTAEVAGSKEGYSLIASPRRIAIAAGDPRGLFYGAVTLAQLVEREDASAALHIPAMRIEDSPRFRWRGLMLDSARHFQSKQFIKQLIDAMAQHKLNVLHWHLTDDQAWRIEIRKYPRLTSVGAWRVPAGEAPAGNIDPQTGQPRRYGGYYSQDDVREIVAYAASRHITIVPEIEMPGHASAAIAAYPELVVHDAGHALPKAVPADWGIYPNLFNVEESTFAFLQDVLSEVIELFPSEYIHIGGDEAVKDQWRASPRVQARMREFGVRDEHELQSYFVQRMEKFLSSRGRRLVGWDEILEGGLAPNATVMSWRGIEGAVAAATAGHDAILSPGPTLYFDNRPRVAPAPPGRVRVVSVQDVYQFDPAPAALTPAQREHVLGVQANVWTEHIRTEERAQYMIFPRLAALAEVAWSPAERIDWLSFSARLPRQLQRYRAAGLNYADVTAEPASAVPGTWRSHDMQLCTEQIPLMLEDDGPVDGERAIFKVDILNPCWRIGDVDLSGPNRLRASVGRIPFNFQIGADVAKVPLRKMDSPAGELQIRAGSCDADPVVTVPLAPAVASHGVTRLPDVALPALGPGAGLCFTFTQQRIDPLWVLDSVELIRGAE